MPKRLVDGEGVWRSQKLRQVELKYRSEYANLLPLAGDRGTFECDPASIWADVYAYNRSDITPEDVESILAEFERVKLLFRWQHEGKSWGYWVGIDRSGLLPKPSERHSKDPVPDEDALTRFTGVSPAPDPRADRVEAAPLPRTGLGLGVGSGSGSGSGNGEGRTVSSVQCGTDGAVASTINKTEKQDQNQKQNLLTILAVTEKVSRAGSAYGYEAVRNDDPLLPLLVKLTDERLALYAESGETLDTPKIEGGCTAREASASVAWSYVQYAVEMLALTDQYIKLSALAPEGMLDFSEALIRKMLGAICEWPNMQSDNPAWRDMTSGLYAAILHWAFKVSDYWPEKLKTLEDVIRSLPKVREQYEKFYRHLPTGKKPHDLGMGWPKEEEAPLCATCGENRVSPVPANGGWAPAMTEDGRFYLNCDECDPPSVIPPPPDRKQTKSKTFEDVKEL